MGKDKKRKKKKKTSTSTSTNFVAEAGPGCYVARRDTVVDSSSSWLIEWEDVGPKEFDDDDAKEEVPDVAIDTDEQTLSVCNVDDCYKVAYVTVYETTVRGANGRRLIPGTTTDNTGITKSCITFIVLVPPHVFVHLCFLEIPHDLEDITQLRIESDVSPWNQHPQPNDEHGYRISFPLGCIPPDSRSSNTNNGIEINNDASSMMTNSYLCTQSEGGELTHFFSGNLHAIDFQCPVGTELLAVADGIVVDVKAENTLTGIAVTNLYEWNSILLQVCKEKEEIDDQIDDNIIPGHRDGPLFVEYVHIQRSIVQKGDFVRRGQVIGYSGSVGFSPEPHLHFSAFRSSDPTAPTVRVRFEDGASARISSEISKNLGKTRTFLPVAGNRYNSTGLVSSL